MGTAILKKLSEISTVEIQGVYNPKIDSAKRTLQEVGLSEDLATDDYGAALARPGVEAVFIVSPNSDHANQAIQALEMNKHLFCEKPCAIDFADYVSLLGHAKARPHLTTYVDYILYFDSMEKRLREMVSRGDFGTLSQIQVNYRHPVNIAGNKAWKLKKEVIGDAIGMGIIHALSVMYWIMEANGTKPVSVFAKKDKARVRPFEVETGWAITVGFDNGAQGFCFGNIDHANGYDAFHHLHGTKGGFVFDSGLPHEMKVRYWSEYLTQGKWIYPLNEKNCQEAGYQTLAWPHGTTTPDSGNVIHHQIDLAIHHFIDSINQGKISPLSLTHSASLTDLGWAALVSATTGEEVSLPLDYSKVLKII